MIATKEMEKEKYSGFQVILSRNLVIKFVCLLSSYYILVLASRVSSTFLVFLTAYRTKMP